MRTNNGFADNKAGTLLRRLAADRAGNVLPLAAAVLLPLTAIVGGALDMSMAYMAKGRLQNACDAGVLAGRHVMQGTVFNREVEAEADRFFNFNFPEGANGATSVEFTVEQSEEDEAEILGEASATIPTILMKIFGFGSIDLAVSCDAKKDFGHNDIVLVLDVTGSMAQNASGGGGKKINRLRQGARGLYAALAGAPNTTTRYGIVPYSHTVNVAQSLAANDFLREQQYVDLREENRRVCSWWSCWNETITVYGTKNVHIKESRWGSSWRTDQQNIDRFRISGDGCIEERSSAGNAASPVRINATVTQDDVDRRAANSNDVARQFGRYDPDAQESESQDGCPAESTRLTEYRTERDFQTAIDRATSRVTGGTYHDVGMLWGTRFISRTGFFSADNPVERDDVPVNMHLVFMTDGILDTGPTLYSAHGIEARQERTGGSGSQNSRHLARFESVCTLAKSMSITIWVIALDVTSTDDIRRCATSTAHFYVSDGSDLEEVFANIGQGIGRLRLTK